MGVDMTLDLSKLAHVLRVEHHPCAGFTSDGR